MANTHIEWTDRVWNPTTGCDRVSPGCDHCYALTMAKRLKGMGQPKYQNDGDPRTSGPGFLATEHESELEAPLRWRKPVKVFVNSMSDLFHERISDEFIASVFVVMAATKRHTYQVLTKRHGRMRSLLASPRFQALAGKAAFDFMQEHRQPVGWSWPLPNVWLGVSVDDQQWADIRVPALLDTPAAVRFLSCEPLLGPVDLSRWLPRPLCGACRADMEAPMCDACYADFEAKHVAVGDLVRRRCFDWVIAGGESGPGARPMHPAWARQLRDQCTAAGVPFHFKQWGEWAPDDRNLGLGYRDRLRDAFLPDGTRYRPTEPDMLFDPGMATLVRVGKKAAGRVLDGRTWDEFPEPHRTEVSR